MKCTELVAQDHVMLRRGLGILEGMVQKLEDGERIEIADIAAVLKFLRFFGDAYHQTMEEQVLFPALLRAAPQEGVRRQLVLEHGEERALLAGIEQALTSKRGMDFARSSRQLTCAFRNHLDKEDAVLRELADRALSTEEDDSIVAAIMKNRAQPETYVKLARMEWKYASKAPGTLLGAGREVGRARGASVYS